MRHAHLLGVTLKGHRQTFSTLQSSFTPGHRPREACSAFQATHVVRLG